MDLQPPPPAQLDRAQLETDLRRLCQGIGDRFLARLSPVLRLALSRSRVDLGQATWDAFSPVLGCSDDELSTAIDALGITMGAWRAANAPLDPEILDAALAPLWRALP